jgi:hypothetical protein
VTYYPQTNTEIKSMKMEKQMCTECETPDLCLAMSRKAEDYLMPDGTLRQIIGCSEVGFIHGYILTDADIAAIGKKLRGK